MKINTFSRIESSVQMFGLKGLFLVVFVIVFIISLVVFFANGWWIRLFCILFLAFAFLGLRKLSATNIRLLKRMYKSDNSCFIIIKKNHIKYL